MKADARPVVMLHKLRSILHFFCSVNAYASIAHTYVLGQPGLPTPQVSLNPPFLTMLEF